MRTVFIYYSLEGNCRSLVRNMAEAVDGDVAELRLTGAMPTGFFRKYLVGGTRSLLKETPALAPLEVNLDDYDLVVVGGPVWAWNVCPAVRSFLSTTDWRGKKVAAFVMHGGGKGKALSTMKSLVEENGGEVVATGDFIDLRRRNADETRERARSWIRNIIAGLAP
ncbi:MAG: NAD(P)H-dependent oxidoreductase [Planctomycetaceae bacterium]|nr:NAD(P)H-dependent oxidoreductase [Planctomycetaceae bacterium]